MPVLQGWGVPTTIFLSVVEFICIWMGDPAVYWGLQVWFCAYLLLYSNQDGRVWELWEYSQFMMNLVTNTVVPASWTVFGWFMKPPSAVDAAIQTVKSAGIYLDPNAVHDRRIQDTSVVITSTKYFVTIFSRLLWQQVREMFVPSPVMVVSYVVELVQPTAGALVNLNLLLTVNVWLVLNESYENQPDKAFWIGMTIGMIVMGVEVVDHVWLRTSRNRITPFLRTIILLVIFAQLLKHRIRRRSDPVVTIVFEAHYCNLETGKAINNKLYRPVLGHFGRTKKEMDRYSWGQCNQCNQGEGDLERQKKLDGRWKGQPDMCEESGSFGKKRGHGEPTIGYIMYERIDVEIVKRGLYNTDELFQQFVQMLGNLMSFVGMALYVHSAHQGHLVMLNRTWWQRMLTIFDCGWCLVWFMFCLPAAILKYKPQFRHLARGGGAARAGAAATGGAVKTCKICRNVDNKPTKAGKNGNCVKCQQPC
jgi:hypothetical protein